MHTPLHLGTARSPGDRDTLRLHPHPHRQIVLYQNVRTGRTVSLKKNARNSRKKSQSKTAARGRSHHLNLLHKVPVVLNTLSKISSHWLI
jgi:hypothetical protein